MTPPIFDVYPNHHTTVKTRRDFLKQGGMAAAAVAVPGLFNPALPTLPKGAEAMPAPDDIRELMMAAINTAKGLGASYSDVRIGRYRNSIVFTREQQIVNTADTDSIGAGIRALVDGTWFTKGNSPRTSQTSSKHIPPPGGTSHV